jgi:hypothetical protein
VKNWFPSIRKCGNAREDDQAIDPQCQPNARASDDVAHIAMRQEKRGEFPRDHDGAHPIVARQLENFGYGKKVQPDNQPKELWYQVIATDTRQQKCSDAYEHPFDKEIDPQKLAEGFPVLQIRCGRNQATKCQNAQNGPNCKCYSWQADR